VVDSLSIFVSFSTCSANAGSQLESPDLVSIRLDAADVVTETLDSGSLLIFGRRVGSTSGRKPRSRSTAPEQASLFSLD